MARRSDGPPGPEHATVEDLAPGAHLVTPRRGYVHHGLYAGDGRVIHYAGFKRPWRRGPIEEVSLEQFARGRGFAVKPRVAPKYPGPAAVERARSRLGENRYRFWSNNCEHFVEWCLTGAGRSAQVDAWRTGFAAIAARLRTRAADAAATGVARVEP